MRKETREVEGAMKPGENASARSSPADVRMRGFQKRSGVAEVVDLHRRRLSVLPAVSVELPPASGRVLAQDVTAAVSVPAFDRSAMDGYAVRGGETLGAGP